MSSIALTHSLAAFPLLASLVACDSSAELDPIDPAQPTSSDFSEESVASQVRGHSSVIRGPTAARSLGKSERPEHLPQEVSEGLAEAPSIGLDVREGLSATEMKAKATVNDSAPRFEPATPPRAADVHVGEKALQPESAVTEALVLSEARYDARWEAFKRDTSRVGPGGIEYFVVEWDLPINSEAALREYYNAKNSGREDKGVLHLLKSGADDVWLNGDQLRLRYCVDTNPSTGFDGPGSMLPSATVIAAMETATKAWQSVANVSFKYDPGNNNNCGISSPIPDSMYIKIARGDSIFSLSGLCSFGPQSKRAWTCPGLDGGTIAIETDFTFTNFHSGASWSWGLMHELGHTLGLAHEQYHTNGGGCGPFIDTRNLTATADTASAMGYPSTKDSCSSIAPTTGLSAGDGIAARLLYGMPAAWHVPVISLAQGS